MVWYTMYGIIYNFWTKVKHYNEWQAGFRKKRTCIYYIIIDNVYTLNEIVQGRLREGIMPFPRCP